MIIFLAILSIIVSFLFLRYKIKNGKDIKPMFLFFIISFIPFLNFPILILFEVIEKMIDFEEKYEEEIKSFLKKVLFLK